MSLVQSLQKKFSPSAECSLEHPRTVTASTQLDVFNASFLHTSPLPLQISPSNRARSGVAIAAHRMPAASSVGGLPHIFSDHDAGGVRHSCALSSTYPLPGSDGHASRKLSSSLPPRTSPLKESTARGSSAPLTPPSSRSSASSSRSPFRAPTAVLEGARSPTHIVRAVRGEHKRSPAPGHLDQDDGLMWNHEGSGHQHFAAARHLEEDDGMMWEYEGSGHQGSAHENLTQGKILQAASTRIASRVHLAPLDVMDSPARRAASAADGTTSSSRFDDHPQTDMESHSQKESASPWTYDKGEGPSVRVLVPKFDDDGEDSPAAGLIDEIDRKYLSPGMLASLMGSH